MSRNYTNYLVDTPIIKDESIKETGTPLRPYAALQGQSMKVRWNDGQIYTEVDVPLLSSGQRIVIDHNTGKGGKDQGDADFQKWFLLLRRRRTKVYRTPTANVA